MDRRKRAGELETAANQVVQAAKAVHAAIEPLAQAWADLVAAIPPGTTATALGTGGLEPKPRTLGPESLAPLVLANWLARPMPQAFAKEVTALGMAHTLRRGIPHGQTVMFATRDQAAVAGPLPAAEAARAVIVDRLCQHARAVRDGSAEPVVPLRPHLAEPNHEPDLDEIPVLMLRNARDTSGGTAGPRSRWPLALPGCHESWLRPPCRRAYTPEGQCRLDEFRKRYARLAHTYQNAPGTLDDCVDLGVDIQAWIAAERERAAGREWRARRQVA